MATEPPGHAATHAHQHQPQPRSTVLSGQRFSYLDTPVEMEHRPFQHHGQYHPTIPPLPTIPRELESPYRSQAEKAAREAGHSNDQKTNQKAAGSHLACNPPFTAMAPVNHAPQDDPQAPQRHPQKPSQPDHYQPPKKNTMSIEPDQNPLATMSPAILKSTRPLEAGSDSHLPGQVTHPNQQVTGGTWKHGLLDCGDVGVCCAGLWCPCVLYGRTQYRLARRSEKSDPTNMLGYQSVNGSCMAFAALCGCNLILVAIQHARVRRMYKIPGSIGSDCVEGVCCCCCTLSQDEKEMKYREDHARKYAGPATGAQYEPPSSMEYPTSPI